MVLMVLWLMLFVLAQLVQYVVAPLVLLWLIPHTKYKDMVYCSKRVVFKGMLVLAVVAALWAVAFGLYVEYATPAAVILEADGGDSDGEQVENEADSEAAEEPKNEIEIELVEGALLTLNEMGKQGAMLRDGVGIEATIIEVVWGEDELVYLGRYAADEHVNGLLWLWVQAPSGTEGYVSSQLIFERNN